MKSKENNVCLQIGFWGNTLYRTKKMSRPYIDPATWLLIHRYLRDIYHHFILIGMTFEPFMQLPFGSSKTPTASVDSPILRGYIQSYTMPKMHKKISSRLVTKYISPIYYYIFTKWWQLYSCSLCSPGDVVTKLSLSKFETEAYLVLSPLIIVLVITRRKKLNLIKMQAWTRVTNAHSHNAIVILLDLWSVIIFHALCSATHWWQGSQRL